MTSTTSPSNRMWPISPSRQEEWNSPMHDMQTRLEICAGAVQFERAVATNMRRQRDELAAQAERTATELPSFPELPPAIVMHEKLGPLYDRLQMHVYAVKYHS